MPEQCGIPPDCRNVICVPKERVARVPALVTQHTVPVDASAAYRPDALLRVPLQRGPPGNETAWKFRKEGGGAAASPPVYRAARTADCGCNWLLFFFLFHAPQYKKHRTLLLG